MSKFPVGLAPLRAGITFLALALAGFWAAPRALAQANSSPPERVTYQGFLADGNGNPLGNTNTGPKNYDVIFRIWADPTGGPSALWAEQQTVTVDKGYFSILLGEGTAVAPEAHNNLSTLFTNSTASDRYVEMTVKGIGVGGANITIQPRLRLLTSPYAYLATRAVVASSVDGGALTTGTVADARLSPNVALRAGGNTFSGDQRFGSGTLYMDNNRAFYAKNSGGADEVFLWPRFGDNVTYLNYGSGGFNIRNNGSLSRMFITDAGNVGIGTTTPGIPLNFANTLGDKISLYGQSGNTYGFGIRGSLLQIHTDAFGADIAFGYGNSASDSGMVETMRIKGNGNVGIGTPSPAARLDVNGNLKVSGGITTGSGASTLAGAAPLIVESKSPNEQTTWQVHAIDLSPWADRPGGFKIRIYAQHELAAVDYEVRNYEATVVFEQPGYANNAQFPSQIYRTSFSWAGNQARQSMKLGTPALTSGGGTQEIFPDGWVKISNYIPNSSSGGTAGGYSYYTGLNKYVVVTFHPHVSGRVVISDN